MIGSQRDPDNRHRTPSNLTCCSPDARIVVAIGNDVGTGRDVRLDYAEADAKRFHRLMMEIGGGGSEVRSPSYAIIRSMLSVRFQGSNGPWRHD